MDNSWELYVKKGLLKDVVSNLFSCESPKIEYIFVILRCFGAEARFRVGLWVSEADILLTAFT